MYRRTEGSSGRRFKDSDHIMDFSCDSLINTRPHILVGTKAVAVSAVIFFFMFLVSRLCADNQKEYIYLDGKVVAVESDKCTYVISPTSASPGAGSGSGSVTVTSSNSACTWTAASNATSWITVTSGSSGTGNGTVGYSISANTGSARSGTITIAANTFTINQPAPPPPCTYGIFPTSVNMPPNGGSNIVTVNRSNASCPLPTATSNASWITATVNGSTGNVSYSASVNYGTGRNGTITISGGNTFTVTQGSGEACADQQQSCFGEIEVCQDNCYTEAISNPVCQAYPSFCMTPYLTCMSNCEIYWLDNCTYYYNRCMSGN